MSKKITYSNIEIIYYHEPKYNNAVILSDVSDNCQIHYYHYNYYYDYNRINKYKIYDCSKCIIVDNKKSIKKNITKNIEEKENISELNNISEKIKNIEEKENISELNNNAIIDNKKDIINNDKHNKIMVKKIINKINKN